MVANGGGSRNARGIRFQNLCALDYALRELESGEGRITRISVEARLDPLTGRVCEELDFSLLAGDVPIVDAQVKSGTASKCHLPEMWRELWRLTRRDAETYLLVTSRRPAPAVRQLAELLATPATGPDQFTSALSELCSGVPDCGSQLAEADSQRRARLMRTRLVLSTDDIGSYQDKLRRRIRELRHRYRKGAGRRSTGLVFRNVLDLIAERATGRDDLMVSLDELRDEIGADDRTVAEAVSERDWDVHAGLAPVVPDVVREDLAESITDAFAGHAENHGIACCVLFGLSGIGKTSLAAGWAADRAYEFDRVFWVAAQDTASLQRSFIVIEDALRQWIGPPARQAATGRSAEALRQRVHRLLSACPGSWLMVFDNAVDAKAVQSWIPRRGWGRVLVTTIEQGAWHGSGISTVEVPRMSRAQSVDLLRRRLLPNVYQPADDEREQLNHLAEFMRDWPLALELAAAYLSSVGTGLGGIDHYTAEIQIRQRSLADSDRGPHGYHGSLVGAIELAAERMNDAPRGDAGSVPSIIVDTMIYLVAHLGEHHIPLQLLIDAAADVTSRPGRSVGSHAVHHEILRSLSRLSLVRRDQDLEWLVDSGLSASSISVHMNEIVQQTLRDRLHRLDPGRAAQLLRHMTHYVAEWLHNETANHETLRALVLMSMPTSLPVTTSAAVSWTRASSACGSGSAGPCA
ncbi:NB-ARC domain-containing protein [Amycolatopsis alkalitolerans]|uniref:Uncharacterized protein n=1 Tax=Amycolatopsis alkalitolerans TaxID=2547244 RepID=A0A5C4M4I5_9PSEU|nr:NB-ARC domain-containing protein [Amycolatopsis alkalitolerans]TNC28026.1 hypothetical protein FG385_06220 [Amycolatopsis alkalitolerans]